MRSDVALSVVSKGSPAQIACPICRNFQLVTCRPGQDRLFGLAQGTFPLFRCKSCGCCFQHPLPEKSALTNFYPREYWWSQQPSKQSGSARLIRRLEKAYREFVTEDHARFLDYCARRNPGSEKLLLDIGCGSGTFLHVARSHGYVPHGMDVSARAVEIAREQYGCLVRQGEIGSATWDDSRFDFITLFHVLEHLPDPRAALKYASGLLRSSGLLVIQVPNISSIQARLFGSRWYGLDVPRHVINFTPKALALLLREMGFEFTLISRFSLRDNPASIASSLVPWLDPIRRKGRGFDSHPALNGLMELIYFGFFLLAIPAALIERFCGFGGTIWACAKPKP